MADRPEQLPRWATGDQTDDVSGQNNVVEPPNERKESGWDRREIPPRQWQNWLARLYYRWIDYIVSILDAATNDETPDTIAKRDAAGRMRAEDPDAAQDVVTKSWTQKNVGNLGYAIYFTSTAQTHDGGGNVAFDSESDSHNVADRISANSGLTELTLQSGYYKISYLATFEHVAGDNPDVSVELYNVSIDSSINYTVTRGEITSSAERTTLSFAFPLQLNDETIVALRADTNTNNVSGDEAELIFATLSIEAVI